MRPSYNALLLIFSAAILTSLSNATMSAEVQRNTPKPPDIDPMTQLALRSVLNELSNAMSDAQVVAEDIARRYPGWQLDKNQFMQGHVILIPVTAPAADEGNTPTRNHTITAPSQTPTPAKK